jgi:hypothetical protein
VRSCVINCLSLTVCAKSLLAEQFISRDFGGRILSNPEEASAEQSEAKGDERVVVAKKFTENGFGFR